MKKLSVEQVQSTLHLSSREAAAALGSSKSTVNDARRHLREGTLENPLPPGGVEIEIRGEQVPRTVEEIDEALRTRGIDPSLHVVTQNFGMWGPHGSPSSASWKARVVPIKGLHEVIAMHDDPIDIMRKLRDCEDPIRPVVTRRNLKGQECAFVYSLNDTQFGKDEGGGTPATLARIERSIEESLDRIEQLLDAGYNITTLVLIGGGDIIEGCAIYPNHSFSLDLDRRGQINTAVASIMNVIDRLGPYFEKIKVLACMGNHGQHRIGGKRVNLHDNDDVLVFEIAKTAYDRDLELGPLIEWIIADEEVGVTTEVCGWVLGTTHGDMLGTGRYPFQKVLESMKRWALGRAPMGKCDVLVTHHYHHEQSADFGSWQWMQTRAQDGGSKWFEQVTGMYSDTGALTFLMTPDRRVSEVHYT